MNQEPIPPLPTNINPQNTSPHTELTYQKGGITPYSATHEYLGTLKGQQAHIHVTLRTTNC